MRKVVVDQQAPKQRLDGNQEESTELLFCVTFHRYEWTEDYLDEVSDEMKYLMKCTSIFDEFGRGCKVAGRKVAKLEREGYFISLFCALEVR